MAVLAEVAWAAGAAGFEAACVATRSEAGDEAGGAVVADRCRRAFLRLFEQEPTNLLIYATVHASRNRSTFRMDFLCIRQESEYQIQSAN